MRLLIFILIITVSSCTQNDSKQKELDLKERELVVKEKELNLQKDSLNAVNKTTVVKQPDVKEETNTTNIPVNEPPANPSKYTGSWIGQGQDQIEIRYNNGQYFITLDADNTSQPNKTVLKAKEENGYLLVEPGLYYGYNGTSTMTLVGTKLVSKSGPHKYIYERG